ncbi:polyprenyl synthetase family protein [Amycolatopsis tolypomycina]|uniref:Geranylgeranyl diphosphate synthase, type I n=1 Tax=Amycolatopsis tolypomycina TaxID=208445 RepID=A0A1H4ZTR3_9PSEU|nr:polyprenyl synthetase family protein [Amycolatopsis tolypomycina]SED33265.1 geranylgeranyl diphosphate synthase, type I [Amycolatopsis tolypomycina]
MSIALEPVQASLGLVREELDRRWPDGRDRLDAMCRHALLPSGKLLRPLLLLESAAAVGGDRARVVPAALAVEYLHGASLVHDDVIDGDRLRRGRDSVMARFGVDDAIVAGDALFMASVTALAECGRRGVPATAVVTALRLFGEAGIRLCRGQVEESAQQGALEGGLPAYLAMADGKTGALFRAACVAGVVLGGGSPADQAAADSYARHLGIAFQMYDDLLPYLRESATTGKAAGSDLANRRPTFPVLVASELAPGRRGEIAAILHSGSAGALARMSELLHDIGAIEHARRRAEAEADRAAGALAGFPASESTAFLGSVAELVVDRER